MQNFEIFLKNISSKIQHKERSPSLYSLPRLVVMGILGAHQLSLLCCQRHSINCRHINHDTRNKVALDTVDATEELGKLGNVHIYLWERGKVQCTKCLLFCKRYWDAKPLQTPVKFLQGKDVRLILSIFPWLYGAKWKNMLLKSKHDSSKTVKNLACLFYHIILLQLC